MTRHTHLLPVLTIAGLLAFQPRGMAQQAPQVGTAPEILSPADPLLRSPFFSSAGYTDQTFDHPSSLDNDLYGQTSGVLLDSGKILLWSGNEFGQGGGGVRLWDPVSFRCESIPLDPSTNPRKQHLTFKGSQILVDERPLGNIVRFDPFKQAWVNEEPGGFNYVPPLSSWPRRVITGGLVLQQDDVSGGEHAWEVFDPKTGSKKHLDLVPLRGVEVGRSDGCIVLLAGKQSQILDPQTGSLKPGPKIQLSGWSQVCVLPGDKVLFAGGTVQTSPIPAEEEGELDGYDGYYSPVRGIYQMDLHTFRINRVGFLRYERIDGFAMIPTPSGKLLIAGGTYGFGPNGKSPVPEIEWLNLKTYKDTARYRLLADRSHAIARELKDGKVLIVGGRMNGPYHQRDFVQPSTPELFDPKVGSTVALQPIPTGWEVVKILEDGLILINEIKVSQTPPYLAWPIKLSLFDAKTGQVAPAGELKTSIAQYRLEMLDDRILFYARTDFNQPDDAATSLELWDRFNGCTPLKTSPYKYLHKLCALKNGDLLFQTIGPGKVSINQTYLLPTRTHSMKEISTPSDVNSSARGFELPDGRVILQRGWLHSYKLNKGFFLLDIVWDPVSGKYYRWPSELLDPVEDAGRNRITMIPRVSLSELSLALGLKAENPDQGVMSNLLQSSVVDNPPLKLRDGRILFIAGSGVRFHPGLTDH